ncbi:Imm26 family immunity protein [Sorangium sp. So ce1024]|uniref:Imm26 family immunity protein n=1 Tax=unclassified Sorangium TaxID=2621164 RepID=UPI003F0E6356
MKKKTSNYGVGTWFAVPLPSGGYGTGLVARANGMGEAFGYFFGPRHPAIPPHDATRSLRPEDAVLLRLFGDLGLIRGEWPILGSDPDLDTSRWTMPGLIHRDDMTGQVWIRHYDERRLGLFLREEPCDPATAKLLPMDGLSGQVALEVHLDKIIP